MFRVYSLVSFDTHKTVNVIKIMKMSITCKGFFRLLCHLFLLPLYGPLPPPSQPLIYLLEGQVFLHFLEIYMNRIKEYILLSSVWLFFLSFLLLSIIILRFTNAVAWISASFIFIAGQYSIVLLYNSLFIRFPVLNICAVSSFWLSQINSFVLAYTLVFWGQISGKELPGLHTEMCFTF